MSFLARQLLYGVVGENATSITGDSNLEHILTHLSSLSLQNASPKRTIKLAIFPDDYDKTIIPPLENGKIPKCT